MGDLHELARIGRTERGPRMFRQGVLIRRNGESRVRKRRELRRVQLSEAVEGFDARKAVELIERQADRMLALVEDLRRINPRE